MAVVGTLVEGTLGVRLTTVKVRALPAVSLPLMPLLTRLSTRRLGVTVLYVAPALPGAK